MTVIACRGVTRRYVQRGIDPVVAVDGVDLDVDAGSFVAIEGPSGSGKTTLLGLLAGLEAPDDGTIERPRPRPVAPDAAPSAPGSASAGSGSCSSRSA